MAQGGIYDEVEIEDMVFDEVKQVYSYPCPCGDRFVISLVRVYVSACMCV
jgi:diphthamide biosynthesis protein 3